MRDLASHNLLANLQLRDRAIAEAARLKALIKLFGSLPDATGFPSRKEREKQCEEWQAAIEKITTTAVILTLEAQQLGPDMREFVEREMRREITEAPLPPNFADQLSAYRRYNAAALSPTLEFVHEQQQNTTAQRIRRLVEFAVKHKRYEMIERLVREEALDPKTMAVVDDDEELSLLAYGIKHELGDSYLEILIEKGADVAVVVGRGETAQTIVGVAVKRQWQRKLIELLIGAGAPIPRLIDGISPLEFLFRRRQFELMDIMIAQGALTEIIIDGKTLLGSILCADAVLSKTIVFGEVYAYNQDGHRYKAFDLISKFKLDARGTKGQTALHDYCKSPLFDRRTFQKLIECGADPGAKTDKGDTVVEMIILYQESKF
jgi:hypothetical protein